MNITGHVFGGADGDYNRIWYHLVNEGFVYSGGVQPVDTVLNDAVTTIPETGVLGEISIPNADLDWLINRSPYPGPRLYYGTILWITALIVDQCDGSLWYKAYDNLYNFYYYT